MWFIETNEGRKVAGPYVEVEHALAARAQAFSVNLKLYVVEHDGTLHPDDKSLKEAYL
jgi:hypothetical protein